MLEKLKNLLGTARSESVRSEDVAKALEAARLEEAAAVARANEFGNAYAQGLLTLDDAKLQELVDARQAATIQRDRAQAVCNALETKLDATRTAEIVAVLTAEKDAAEAEALAVVRLIQTEYPQIAKSLVAMLERMSKADDVIIAVNEKLRQAKRSNEVMQRIEPRVMVREQHGSEFNLWGTVQLKEYPGFAPGWNSPGEIGGQCVIVMPDHLKQKASPDMRWKM